MNAREALNIHGGQTWRRLAQKRYRTPLPAGTDQMLYDVYRPTGQDEPLPEDPWIPEGPGVPEPAPPEGEITMEPLVLKPRSKIAPRTMWMAALGLVGVVALWSAWEQSAKKR